MKSGSFSTAAQAPLPTSNTRFASNVPAPRFRRAATAASLAIALASLDAAAASIQQWQYSVDDTDTIAFTFDSVLATTLTNRIGRFRVNDGLISKMVLGVRPNTNLVAIDTNAWFTTRTAPYSVGRANLGTVSGDPVYFAPLDTPYDDMVLGPDNSLWASNAASGVVMRVTQAGVATPFTGDGAIRPVGIARGNDGAVWFADGANRRIGRIDATTGGTAYFPVPQLSVATVPERITALPGTNRVAFATDDGFGIVDPSSGNVRMAPTASQHPKRIAAGRDGTVWMTDGTAYVTQFTPPSSYAKLRVFDEPLAQSSGIFVDPAGTLYVTDRAFAMLARVANAENTPADTTIVEFHNTALDHYFVTADPAEAAGIDAGAAGGGWIRTGQTWKAWLNGPLPNAAEVCRFYGSPDIDAASGLRRGPNSHFYTVDPAECAGVKTDAGWQYEAAAKHWMIKPVAGACPSWTTPIYRAYNGGYATNNSNHRYAASISIYNEMTAKGWQGEGVVMCAPQ